ncbi:MAG TPA: hypothetical protein VIH07_02345 [Candidatus Humimicrobiaceae bacterium]
MSFLDKLFGRKKAEPVIQTGQGRIEELIAKLTPDIKEDGDSELGSDSFQAAKELAHIGQSAIKPLIQMLSISSRAHYALGLIGGETVFQALCRELETGNWRRIEAAARALGKMCDRRALEPLRLHTGTSSFEIHRAVTEAIAAIEQAHIGIDNLFKVDHDNPVGQVERFWSLQNDFRRDPAKRDQFIQWHAKFVDDMPDMKFDSDKTRGRIWGMLGTMIYYMFNPMHSTFSDKCAEAAYCYEQCLKYTPERMTDIGTYLKRVK